MSSNEAGERLAMNLSRLTCGTTLWFSTHVHMHFEVNLKC